MLIDGNSARFGRPCLAAGLFLSLLGGCSQRESPATGVSPAVAVVPAPAAVELHEGSFTVRAGTPVEFAAVGEVERIARYFGALVARTHGIELAPALNAEPGSEQTIRFELSAVEGLSGEEGYSLRVSPQRIVVSAGSPRGLFYGAAKSASGDLEIRLDRCDGELLASLPLTAALGADQLRQPANHCDTP